MPYIAAYVDASRNGILGLFSPPLAGESFDTCSKARASSSGHTSRFSSWPALLSVGKLGSMENDGETNF